MGGKGTFVVVAIPNLAVTQTLAANQMVGGGGCAGGGAVTKGSTGPVPAGGGAATGSAPSPGKRDQRGRDRDRDKGSDNNNKGSTASHASTPTPSSSTAPTVLYNAMGSASSPSAPAATNDGSPVQWQTSQEWDNRRLLQVDYSTVKALRKVNMHYFTHL